MRAQGWKFFECKWRIIDYSIQVVLKAFDDGLPNPTIVRAIWLNERPWHRKISNKFLNYIELWWVFIVQLRDFLFCTLEGSPIITVYDAWKITPIMKLTKGSQKGLGGDIGHHLHMNSPINKANKIANIPFSGGYASSWRRCYHDGPSIIQTCCCEWVLEI